MRNNEVAFENKKKKKTFFERINNLHRHKSDVDDSENVKTVIQKLNNLTHLRGSTNESGWKRKEEQKKRIRETGGGKEKRGKRTAGGR